MRKMRRDESARGKNEERLKKTRHRFFLPVPREQRRRRDRLARGVSEKRRWIHLYSMGRISGDYLRIAGLDEHDFYSPRIYLDSSSFYSIFKQMHENNFSILVAAEICSNMNIKNRLIPNTEKIKMFASLNFQQQWL